MARTTSSIPRTAHGYTHQVWAAPMTIKQSFTCLDLVGKQSSAMLQLAAAQPDSQVHTLLVFSDTWVYFPLRDVGFFVRRTREENRGT